MKRIIILMGLLLTGVIHAQNSNVTRGASASQSSQVLPASNAIDGNTNTFAVSGFEDTPWLELSFAQTNWINHLEVLPRASNAPTNFFVFVSNLPFNSATTNVAFDPDVTTFSYRFQQWVNFPQVLQVRRPAKFIRIQVKYPTNLEIGELAVFGYRFDGPLLEMQHRIFVFQQNGHSVTDRQDVVIMRGMPNLRYGIDSKMRLEDTWTRKAETITTNYEHRWVGPRISTNSGNFYRTEQLAR